MTPAAPPPPDSFIPKGPFYHSGFQEQDPPATEVWIMSDDLVIASVLPFLYRDGKAVPPREDVVRRTMADRIVAALATPAPEAGVGGAEALRNVCLLAAIRPCLWG